MAMPIELTPALRALDWSGCGLGLLGAYLLAFNSRVSRYGWFAFLGANIAYIALTREIGIGGMLAQNLGYLGSSLLGVYRSFFAQRWQAREAGADQAHAWRITARLAALAPACIAQAPAELAQLIRAAQDLHPATSAGARDTERPS